MRLNLGTTPYMYPQTGYKALCPPAPHSAAKVADTLSSFSLSCFTFSSFTLSSLVYFLFFLFVLTLLLFVYFSLRLHFLSVLTLFRC